MVSRQKQKSVSSSRVVSAEGVATDPSKTGAVSQWPTTGTLNNLRSFLGFASYYRQFVPSFAETAAPLHKLVAEISEKGKKNKDTITSERWEGECHSLLGLMRLTRG